MLPRWLSLFPALVLGLIAQGILSPTASAQYLQTTYAPVAASPSATVDPYALSTQGSSSARGPSLMSLTSLIAPSGYVPIVAGPTHGPRFWFSTEYLLWKNDGMYLPPLVTSSPPGTPRETAAVLGEPGTVIVFGARRVNDDAVSGFRINTGYWFGQQRMFGIEGEYFRLGQQVSRFRTAGDGAPILGRPFFDILAGQQTAQLISYPDLVSGAIAIDAKTDLQSAMIAPRASLCPTHGHPCDCEKGDRVDWLIGYRFLELNDQLGINQGLISELETEPGTVATADRFETYNRFHGLQLGIVHRASYHRAWLESMLRVALGGNRQTVNIFGGRAITEDEVTDLVEGGILAQPSNIASFRRNEFVMVPEVGVKLGARWTKCFHATIGFTALYLPNVVRGGDQIDLDLNPSYLDEDDFVGAPRPRVTFLTTDYWAYGMTLGGELRF